MESGGASGDCEHREAAEKATRGYSGRLFILDLGSSASHGPAVNFTTGGERSRRCRSGRGEAEGTVAPG